MACLDRELENCVEEILLLPEVDRLFPTCCFYCTDWLLKGSCRFPRCKYLHDTNQSTQDYSVEIGFEIRDSFKQKCNKILAELSKVMEDRRCFVLDGKNAATSKALARPKELIMAPNLDSASVEALSEHSLSVRCTSSCAIKHAAECGVHFGTVYLDYMWPLDFFESNSLKLANMAAKANTAGSLDAERSNAIDEVLGAQLEQLDALNDIAQLFGNDDTPTVLSSEGVVLAITLTPPDHATQQKRLEDTLKAGGERLGYGCRIERLGFLREQTRNVLAIFYLVNVDSSLLPCRPAGLQGPRQVLRDGTSADVSIQRETSTIAPTKIPGDSKLKPKKIKVEANSKRMIPAFREVKGSCTRIRRGTFVKASRAKGFGKRVEEILAKFSVQPPKGPPPQHLLQTVSRKQLSKKMPAKFSVQSPKGPPPLHLLQTVARKQLSKKITAKFPVKPPIGAPPSHLLQHVGKKQLYAPGRKSKKCSEKQQGAWVWITSPPPMLQSPSALRRIGKPKASLAAKHRRWGACLQNRRVR